MSGTIKSLFVGEYNSGKSALLERIVNDVFGLTSPTVGVEFHILDVPGNDHRVTAWNLGGAPRFQEILRLYYKHSQIIFIVVDASVPSNVGKWVRNAKDLCPDARIVLVFTKVDLRMHYTMEETQIMRKHYGLYGSILVSSKDMTSKEILDIMAPMFGGLVPRESCLTSSPPPQPASSLWCCLLG